MRHDKHNWNREVLPGIGEALAVIAAFALTMPFTWGRSRLRRST